MMLGAAVLSSLGLSLVLFATEARAGRRSRCVPECCAPAAPACCAAVAPSCCAPGALGMRTAVAGPYAKAVPDGAPPAAPAPIAALPSGPKASSSKASGPAPAPAVAETKVEKALNALTDVEFILTPLVHAMLFLEDQHSINIRLDKAALEKAEVPLNTPVDLRVSGLRLRSVLNLLLKPLKLGYVVEGDGLKITTRDAAGTADTGDSGPSPLEQKIRKALDQKGDVEFVETPLGYALMFLRDVRKIDFWIDETALRNARVDLHTPVTLTFGGTLRETLDKILKPLKLTYFVEDEVLKVTTEAAANER